MVDPLLECRHAAVAEGSCCTEALEFSIDGPSAVVVGGPAVLAKAAMGIVPVRSGALRVRGWSPAESVQRGAMAGVLRDWIVPRTWTLRHALVESARLAGLSTGEAQARVSQVAEAVLLVPVLDRPFASAPLVVRRAASLASALATHAQALVLEDLFEGLSLVEAVNFGEVAMAAIGDRAWICFCSSFDEGHPMAKKANEIVVLEPGKPTRTQSFADLCGPPAHYRTHRFRVLENVDKVIDELSALGVVLVSRQGDRLVVQLGEHSTADLFAVALSCGTLITELAPVSAALA